MTASNDNADKGLLPAGMSDTLPPDAAFEAKVIEDLMAAFAGYGYERVKPPLLEFEDSLFRGPGAATANDAFRLMDPVSQRMMALRADMTPQIARIATNRLTNALRPLRLGYAGQILRIRGSQLRGSRQFGQVGAEIIGTEERAADAEIVLMATEALLALGVHGLSVDLCIPTLVPAICRDLAIDKPDDVAALRAALDRKDAAGVDALRGRMQGGAVDLFGALLAATGEADAMLEHLAALPLGENAARERADLETVADNIRRAAPDLSLTIDPVERRGWEYHLGVSFTLFARGARGELGAGGRYLTGDTADPAGREHATGLTLFTDSLIQALGNNAVPRKLYLPFGTDAALARDLRDEGWVTVQGLTETGDIKREARRLGCNHALSADEPEAL